MYSFYSSSGFTAYFNRLWVFRLSFKERFSVNGYSELRYDDAQKRVISENIEASQELRVYTSNNLEN